jgi:mRNA-degrading endonuclease RelE of RelBE toxin-antitoxin system
MLNVQRNPNFINKISKIKDNSLKQQVIKRIKKIIEEPEIGKPMRYAKKGTREVYVRHFRLSYIYLPNENKIVFFDFYHKKKQ